MISNYPVQFKLRNDSSSNFNFWLNQNMSTLIRNWTCLSETQKCVSLYVMKYLTVLFLTFVLCSCDSMEIKAQEEPVNSSPCDACEGCGSEDIKVEDKPTS